MNHPNVAQIYGLEESGKRPCIVMELVEGETLQERLKRAPIPLDEALPIAKQILEALESAHERGIIHRDLKPANVKIAPGGSPDDTIHHSGSPERGNIERRGFFKEGHLGMHALEKLTTPVRVQ